MHTVSSCPASIPMPEGRGFLRGALMTKKQSKRILSVTVKRMIDADGDTSWMGEYSNTPKTDYAIDRQELGDQGRNEFRYFNGPVENYKGESPENIRKYIRQDYDRMQALQRGDFYFLGIRAEAQIQTDSGIIQRITSGGLWQIESDSDDGYLETVQTEELGELKKELLSFGFSRRAIATAYKNVQEKDQ